MHLCNCNPSAAGLGMSKQPGITSGTQIIWGEAMQRGRKGKLLCTVPWGSHPDGKCCDSNVVKPASKPEGSKHTQTWYEPLTNPTEQGKLRYTSGRGKGEQPRARKLRQPPHERMLQKKKKKQKGPGSGLQPAAGAHPGSAWHGAGCPADICAR